MESGNQSIDQELIAELSKIADEFKEPRLFHRKDRVIDAIVLDYLIQTVHEERKLLQSIAEYFAQLKTAGEILGELNSENKIYYDSLKKLKINQAEIRDHRFTTGPLDNSSLEKKVAHALDAHINRILPKLFEGTSIENKKQALVNCVREAGDRYFAHHPKLSNEEKKSILNYLKKMEEQIHIFLDKDLKNMKFEYKMQQLHEQVDKDFILPKKLQQYLSQEFLKYENGKIRFNESYDTITLNYTKDDYKNEKHYQHDYSRSSNHSEEQFQREVKIKTWKPPKGIEKHPKRIIIAIHGWRDSVEAWNNVGHEAVQRGCMVVAYDQRGFGYDKDRPNSELDPERLVMDLKKFIEYQIKQHGESAEFVLMGHSMGSALLLHPELTEFIKDKPQIKGAVCLSPAISEDIIPHFPIDLKYKEGHREQLEKQKASPRFSSLVEKIPTVINLFRLMRDSSKGLIKMIKSNKQEQPYHIIYGQYDAVVNPKYLEEAEKKNLSEDQVIFHKVPRGPHILHMLRESQNITHRYLDWTEEIFNRDKTFSEKIEHQRSISI